MKRGDIIQQTLIEIILIGLVFGLFFLGLNYRVQSNAIKQQIIEKQTAMLIESAEKGMDFEIYMANRNGVINDIRIDQGKVFAYVGDSTISEGYPFFSRGNVEIKKETDRFVISIK